MSEPDSGQFKSFRMLWLPFSLPAVMLGTAAWLIFYFSNALLAYVFKSADSAADAVAHFAVNVKSFVFTLTLARRGEDSGFLFALQCLLALFLWSTFGLAISRCMALRLTRDEYVSWQDAWRFGRQHCKSALFFPVLLASSCALLALLNATIGALIQIPYVGVVAYLLLPIAYVSSALMLTVGLTGAYGVGLVSGAIAVERRGTMDAWGKSLNYIFARPIQFIIYLVVTKVFVIDIVYHYGVEVGILHTWTNSSRGIFFEGSHFDVVRHRGQPAEGFVWFLQTLYWVIGAAFKAFIFGFVISLAVAAFTCMFLIMRREVDGIDVSDIDLLGETDVDSMPDPVPTATAPTNEASPASAPEPAAPNESPSAPPNDSAGDPAKPFQI